MNKKILFPLIVFMGILTASINGANGILANQVGLLESVLLIHFIGSIFSILYYIFLEKNKKKDIVALFKTKPYLFLGGFIGAFAVVSISFAVQNIGVFLVSTALIAGQFILSFVIDLKGWFGFDKLPITKEKIMAILLMCFGLVLLTL